MHKLRRSQTTKSVLALAIAVITTGVQTGLAAIPPMMGAQVPPPAQVIGVGAQTAQGLGVTFITTENSRTTLRSGTTDLPNNPPGQPPGQGNDNWRYTFLLDYNVYKNLTLLLSVPYVYNRDYEQGLHFTTSGVGDLDLFAKYSVYRDQVFNARKELQGIAGIEFPTGSTNVQSDQGALLSATEQAGSGTTNLFLGGAWLWTFPRGSTYGDLIYKFYGTNASYKFGNVLTITEGVDYPLPLEPVKKLSLTTELTGQFVSRDTSDNTSAPGVLASGQVDASGSDTIFIAPGLRWRPHAYWTVGFAPQIPIYQNLRGMQLKTSVIYMLTISTRLGAPSVAGE